MTEIALSHPLVVAICAAEGAKNYARINKERRILCSNEHVISGLRAIHTKCS